MNSSNNYNELRSVFRERFHAFANDNKVNVCNEWEATMPDFVPVLIKFFDAQTNRILTVQETSGNIATDSFDFAIRKTGIYFEQADLLLVYKNALENIPSIFEIYKKWFMEKVENQEMEEILTKQTKHR